MGHIVSERGIEVDLEKIIAIDYNPNNAILNPS